MRCVTLRTLICVGISITVLSAPSSSGREGQGRHPHGTLGRTPMEVETHTVGFALIYLYWTRRPKKQGPRKEEEVDK